MTKKISFFFDRSKVILMVTIIPKYYLLSISRSKVISIQSSRFQAMLSAICQIQESRGSI